MNVSKRRPDPDGRPFLDEISSLLAPWGMPRAAGRLYAYLLLKEAPVTLDQIAADLGMSKSGACNAALLLERFGNARRHGEPGSKRVLYGAPDNLAGPLAAQSTLIGTVGRLLRNAADGTESTVVTHRLRDMAKFYGAMHSAMNAAIAELAVED